MKIALKILVAPVTLAVSILVRLCAALISCTAFLFGLAGTLLMLLALILLLTGSTQNAAILAVIAFLVCPLGLPMLAVRLLGGLQGLNLSLRDRIYG